MYNPELFEGNLKVSPLKKYLILKKLVKPWNEKRSKEILGKVNKRTEKVLHISNSPKYCRINKKKDKVTLKKNLGTPQLKIYILL